MKNIKVAGCFLKRNYPVTFFLLIASLSFLHPAFSFGFKKEKVLPLPYWVDTQNRNAFESWEKALALNPGRNFVMAPLQVTRGNALAEAGFSLKAPAFPPEEIPRALNALKGSIFDNRDHQMKVRYEEFLLVQTRPSSARDFKTLSKSYRVKHKKVNFKNKKKLENLKIKFLKKFTRKPKGPFEDSDKSPDAIPLSGFSLEGAWRDAFDTAKTHRAKFKSKGRSVFVSMMSKSGYHGYFAEDTFQALDLRYGDGKVSFLIFLPAADQNLAAFYETLDFDHWKQWMDAFIERQGMVQLPRFKIETIAGNGSQYAGFELSEAGGESSFQFDMTEILGTESRFELNANHPFFFAVRDNETGLILLMGQCLNPSAARDRI